MTLRKNGCPRYATLLSEAPRFATPRLSRKQVQCCAMRKLVTQFLKFSAVGLSAFAIDYGLFLLLHALGMQYLLANIVSYTVSTIYNFCMSMRYVFAGRTGQTRTQQFIIFFTLSIIGLGLNELFLWLFVEFAHVIAAISKVIATFLVMIFNFLTRKFFFEDHARLEEKKQQLRERRNND